MKTRLLAAAALVSLTAITAASADSRDAAKASPGAKAPAPLADQPIRMAEGLLGRFWDRDGHGERHGRRHRWPDDDDDDGDGDGRVREHHARGGANRAADPNPSTAPVPDNGVFTGKARPKVEVQ